MLSFDLGLSRRVFFFFPHPPANVLEKKCSASCAVLQCRRPPSQPLSAVLVRTGQKGFRVLSGGEKDPMIQMHQPIVMNASKGRTVLALVTAGRFRAKRLGMADLQRSKFPCIGSHQCLLPGHDEKSQDGLYQPARGFHLGLSAMVTASLVSLGC